MKKRLFAVFIIMAIIGPKTSQVSLGQTSSIQAPPNTGDFIIQTVIKKAKENDLIKRETLAYERVYTNHSLNDNGQVIDPERPKEEEVVTIERGGQERVTEKKKYGMTVKPGTVKPGNVSAPRFDLIKALEAVAKFHNFEIDRIEMMAGRPNYVINFKPKPGPRANGDVEEIIVRSEGVIYIDIEKFYIKQFSGWMVRPYSRGGIFGWNIFNLTQANIEMAQKEFDNISVMSSVVITDKYSLFGVETFEKQEYTYQDYRKIP